MVELRRAYRRIAIGWGMLLVRVISLSAGAFIVVEAWLLHPEATALTLLSAFLFALFIWLQPLVEGHLLAAKRLLDEHDREPG